MNTNEIEMNIEENARLQNLIAKLIKEIQNKEEETIKTTIEYLRTQNYLSQQINEDWKLFIDLIETAISNQSFWIETETKAKIIFICHKLLHFILIKNSQSNTNFEMYNSQMREIHTNLVIWQKELSRSLDPDLSELFFQVYCLEKAIKMMLLSDKKLISIFYKLLGMIYHIDILRDEEIDENENENNNNNENNNENNENNNNNNNENNNNNNNENNNENNNSDIELDIEDNDNDNDKQMNLDNENNNNNNNNNNNKNKNKNNTADIISNYSVYNYFQILIMYLTTNTNQEISKEIKNKLLFLKHPHWTVLYIYIRIFYQKRIQNNADDLRSFLHGLASVKYSSYWRVRKEMFFAFKMLQKTYQNGDDSQEINKEMERFKYEESHPVVRNLFSEKKPSEYTAVLYFLEETTTDRGDFNEKMLVSLVKNVVVSKTKKKILNIPHLWNVPRKEIRILNSRSLNENENENENQNNTYKNGNGPRNAQIQFINARMNEIRNQFATQNIVVLYGKHGSGKTMIATQYTHYSQELHPQILWITGNSEIGVRIQMIFFAKQIGLLYFIKNEEHLLEKLNGFFNRQKDWLIIYQDLSEEMAQSPWFLKTNTKTLVTTSSKKIGESLNPIKFGRISADEIVQAVSSYPQNSVRNTLVETYPIGHCLVDFILVGEMVLGRDIQLQSLESIRNQSYKKQIHAVVSEILVELNTKDPFAVDVLFTFFFISKKLKYEFVEYLAEKLEEEKNNLNENQNQNQNQNQNLNLNQNQKTENTPDANIYIPYKKLSKETRKTVQTLLDLQLIYEIDERFFGISRVLENEIKELFESSEQEKTGRYFSLATKTLSSYFRNASLSGVMESIANIESLIGWFNHFKKENNLILYDVLYIANRGLEIFPAKPVYEGVMRNFAEKIQQTVEDVGETTTQEKSAYAETLFTLGKSYANENPQKTIEYLDLADSIPSKSIECAENIVFYRLIAKLQMNKNDPELPRLVDSVNASIANAEKDRKKKLKLLYTFAGIIYQYSNQKDSIEYFKRALSVRDRKETKSDLECDCEMFLGLAQVSTRMNDEAEQTFVSAIESYSALYGSTFHRVASCYMGRGFNEKSRHSEGVAEKTKNEKRAREMMETSYRIYHLISPDELKSKIMSSLHIAAFSMKNRSRLSAAKMRLTNALEITSTILGEDDQFTQLFARQRDECSRGLFVLENINAQKKQRETTHARRSMQYSDIALLSFETTDADLTDQNSEDGQILFEEHLNELKHKHPNPSDLAKVLHSFAESLIKSARFNDALQYAVEARSIYDRLNIHDYDCDIVLGNIYAGLRDQENFERQIQHIRNWIGKSEKKEDHFLQILDCEYLSANFYYQIRQLDSADEKVKEIMSIYTNHEDRDLSNKEKLLFSKTHLVSAYIHYSRNFFQATWRSALRALEMVKSMKPEPDQEVLALAHWAIFYGYRSDEEYKSETPTHEQTIESHFLQAYEAFKKTSLKPQTALCHRFASDIFAQKNIDNKSPLDHLHDALAIYQSLKGRKNQQIETLNQMGKLMLDKKNITDALAHFKNAIDIQTDDYLNEKYKSFHFISQIYLSQKKFEESIKSIHSAIDLCQKFLNSSDTQSSEYLGDLYFSCGEIYEQIPSNPDSDEKDTFKQLSSENFKKAYDIYSQVLKEDDKKLKKAQSKANPSKTSCDLM